MPLAASVPPQPLPATAPAPVLTAWAHRVQLAADGLTPLAGELARRGSGPGLVGPAGDALEALLQRLAADVRALADSCAQAARALAAEALAAQAAAAAPLPPHLLPAGALADAAAGRPR